MTSINRTPGWDKRAINEIAREVYGGLTPMFEVHGWQPDGRAVSQIAPTRVVETYGSVEAFVRSHENGLAGNAMLDPRIAVIGENPDVWVTEYLAFSPDTWGCDGFQEESWRDDFIERSRPGALMICYCENGGKRTIHGILQLSHVVGEKWDFISDEEADWARRERESDWNYAVKAVRAWQVAKDARPTIEEFAQKTFIAENEEQISWRGMKLTRQEALKVLDLPLTEVAVYGGSPIAAMLPGLTEEVLRPSRAGPVSRTSYSVREAEGPKHLYILRLNGDADDFLGKSAGGRWIVKVGFSVSPVTRLHAFNQALPNCAFKWRLLHSTYKDEGDEAFPSSKHALAGEAVMKDYLEENGQSLGGEFFLADEASISQAWRLAIAAAKNWKQ